jgi:hypothetical protein
MNPDHFVKVFDVLQSGYRDWPFPVFGLIFVVVGLVIACLPYAIELTGLPFVIFKPGKRLFCRYAMLGFAILWTGIAFFITYPEHLRHSALVRENRCSLVVGPVQDFASGPKGESFSVSGVPFSYADSRVTDGFNNTSAYGGPLKSDSFVRVCYDPSDRMMLRLEIRDFAGKPKDYSGLANWFSQPAVAQGRDRRAPKSAPPWYGNLILPLFALDVMGIQLLLLPYLRTFFRIKTVTIRDVPIPSTLGPGAKTKLGNTTVRWDRERHIIWVRPRGLNSFQVPFTVAALNIDERGSFIRGFQVRFSTGFLVVLAVMILTLYRAMSADFPQMPWIAFLGISALMGVIAGAAAVLISRRRMEMLAHDGLSDLARQAGPWARAASP